MERAMNDPEIKPLFDKSFVTRWLTLYEQNSAIDTRGADSLIRKYKGYDQGIPYFLVFAPDGSLLADSQIEPGSNVGCPAEADEIAFLQKC
jgi:hypothetical protein